MKPYGKFRGIAICLFIAVLLLVAASGDSLAQDSVSAKSGKKEIVVLKMKKDVNGKKTVIDTSFTISSPSGHQALEEYLKTHEAELEALGDKLKDIDFSLSVTDSIDADSLTAMAHAYCERICAPHFRWHQGPWSFDYDFDIPCPEEFDFEFPDGDEVMKYSFPQRNVQIIKNGSREATLADVIGDIPMERVKSYSVKEKKGGKRIVIEVEDGPPFVNEDRVIIIDKQHGKSFKGSPGGKEKRVKVIIEPEDKESPEKF